MLVKYYTAGLGANFELLAQELEVPCFRPCRKMDGKMERNDGHWRSFGVVYTCGHHFPVASAIDRQI